jgi:O-succinylbenzoate synthase
MKVDHSIYYLQAADPLKPFGKMARREGALLQVHFGDGTIGYADCHPWPELGDLPLQIQLNRLKEKIPTALMQCSLRFAQLDAQARKKKRALLFEREIPKSHYLATHFTSWTPQEVTRVRDQGFTHLKIKIGRHLDEEGLQLLKLFEKSSLKLRLDFNESLNFESCQRFLNKIEILKPFIDFIEDPFPFHAKQWEEVQKQGWVLACDRHAVHACQHPRAAAVLIIKPALQQEAIWKNWTNQRRVVTSYLDHPFGQLTAAYTAVLVDPKGEETHGLLSHPTYAPNPFSLKLAQSGPHFKVPAGDGFGFESELVKLPWKPLIY